MGEADEEYPGGPLGPEEDGEEDHLPGNRPDGANHPEFEERLGPDDDHEDDLEGAELDQERGRAGAPLIDDRNAEDLEIGEPEVTDAAQTSHPDDDRPIEIGESHVDFDDHAQLGGDDGDDRLEQEPDELLPVTPDDGGAEGFSGEAADLLVDEGALPAMDAGEEGDFELHDLLGELGFGDGDAWEPLPSVGPDVALARVVVRERSLAAAGTALVTDDAAGPRITTLTRFARDVALLPDMTALLVTESGLERVRAGERHEPLRLTGDARRVAIAAERVFLLEGSRLATVDPVTGETRPVHEEVGSIGAAGGTLYFVARVPDGAGARLFRIRGQDGAVEALPEWGELPAEAQIAAACASAVALIHGAGALVVRAGVAPIRVAVPGIAAACFREKTMELIVAVVREHAIDVLVAELGGPLARVAQLPRQGAAQAPVGLAWHDAGDCLLIAGPSGLTRLRPRLAH